MINLEKKFSIDEVTKFHRESGKIAHAAQKFALKEANVGMKYLDLAEKVEGKIIELGGEIGFPINLSRNDEAAHYTPGIEDERVIDASDVIKVDLGVHINGFIADCAFTLDVSGENDKLVDASRNALLAAIDMIKPGVTNRQVGKTIEKTITSAGFKPISNLCGHAVKRFHLHAGISIPNIEAGNYTFKEGDVFACEPFATDGAGSVTDGDSVEIFSVMGSLKARIPTARKVGEVISGEFPMLPFARRHVARKMPELSNYSVSAAFLELVKNGGLHAYPTLMEDGNGQVSQFETTLIVTKDGCEPFIPIID